jgi:hypothetical protein
MVYPRLVKWRTGARRTALVAVILSVGVAPIAAQARPDPCTASATNPADASLRVSLRGGQPVFHEGEIIGLTLAFTSSATGKYFLNTRNYDRSGRLNAETFCIEPTAGRDPLDDYFRSGLSGFFGGGLGSQQPLTTVASNVDIELNESKVLPPGRYRLRLMSGRIDRSATAGEPGSGSVSVPLWSNVIDFEVVAAIAEWQTAELDAATKAVDSGADDAAKRHGARVLRFLGSDAATRELARRFFALNDQPFGWEFMFGLIASPHRQTAIDTMTAAIADPSHPITREFIETLALLEIQASGQYELPPYTEATKDAWTSLRARKVDAYQSAIARHAAELAAALGTKTGTARAISINAMLTMPAAATDRANLQQLLLTSWDALPLRTQNELIQYRWDEIGGAGSELLPILRRIINAPPRRGGPPDQPERAPALARLYQLSPSEGRELILREILNTRGDIGIGTLGRLPDRELPEIEEPIMARLRGNNGATEVDYQLLARYATARPLADLQRVYERHRGAWACAQQTAMLQYFLRIDRKYGVAEVTFALGQRQLTGCYTALLGDLKESLAIPEIERLAIAMLDDPSPEVVRNAAEALGRYGSAEAEAPLWRRLQTFHEIWKDRSDELRARPIGAPGRAAEGMIEYALMNALAQGEAWISGTETLARLKMLVSSGRQNELAARLADWQRGQFQLSLSWSGDRFLYSVAQYNGGSVAQLVRKLRQFPTGTRMEVSITPEVERQHRADIEAVQQAARAAGVVLEIKRSPPGT